MNLIFFNLDFKFPILKKYIFILKQHALINVVVVVDSLVLLQQSTSK